MKTANRAILSALALGLTAAMSTHALAASVEIENSVYDLARELSTPQTTGQAGPAGPGLVPGGATDRNASATPEETRFSVYDLADGANAPR